MAWTYNSDPMNNKVDAVRLKIGDTDATNPLLQDEEINYFLSDNPSVQEAAIASALAIAAKFSVLTDSASGKYRENCSQKAAAFIKLAERLRAERTTVALPYAGGLTSSDKEMARHNMDRVGTAFSRGMMGNE
jgi:hypothetical protein